MKKTCFVLRIRREIPGIQTNELGLDARILFGGRERWEILGQYQTKSGIKIWWATISSAVLRISNSPALKSITIKATSHLSLLKRFKNKETNACLDPTLAKERIIYRVQSGPRKEISYSVFGIWCWDKNLITRAFLKFGGLCEPQVIDSYVTDTRYDGTYRGKQEKKTWQSHDHMVIITNIYWWLTIWQADLVFDIHYVNYSKSVRNSIT